MPDARKGAANPPEADLGLVPIVFPGHGLFQRVEGAHPDTAPGRTKGSAAPRSPGERPQARMLSGPHGPPARRPCECRPHASSPQRCPRCSPSGARSPGAPQTGAQAASTDGARHLEPRARRAQPSRPSRARADCASRSLSGSAHSRATNQRRPARGLSGVVVRPWTSGSGSECRAESARAALASLALNGEALGPSLRREETWGQRPLVLEGQTPDQSVHLLTSGSVFLGRSLTPETLLGDLLELGRQCGTLNSRMRKKTFVLRPASSDLIQRMLDGVLLAASYSYILIYRESRTQ